MSVTVEADVILLSGRCAAEDAETLLAALQERPRPVDLATVQRMHMAVLQVILALDPPLRALPPLRFLRQIVSSAHKME